MGTPVVVDCRFTITYPELDKNLKESNSEVYYFNIFGAILRQGNKGFKHIKIYSAAKSGTKIRYGMISSAEESEKVKASMIAMAKDFNEKYNTQIEIEEDK